MHSIHFTYCKSRVKKYGEEAHCMSFFRRQIVTIPLWERGREKIRIPFNGRRLKGKERRRKMRIKLEDFCRIRKRDGETPGKRIFQSAFFRRQQKSQSSAARLSRKCRHFSRSLLALTLRAHSRDSGSDSLFFFYAVLFRKGKIFRLMLTLDPF